LTFPQSCCKAVATATDWSAQRDECRRENRFWRKSSESRLFERYFEFFDSFVTFVEKNSKPPTSHALNGEDPKPGSPRIPIIIHSIIMFLLCPQHRDLLPACRKSYAFPMNQALLNVLMRRRCRRSCCTWC